MAGVKEKIPYLKEINADAVWISPFYESPMKDWGYDVANYTEIDSRFGTMADFDELLSAMHNEGLIMSPLFYYFIIHFILSEQKHIERVFKSCKLE